MKSFHMQLWLNAWGFDSVYDAVLVKPYRTLVRGLAADWIDVLINLSGGLARLLYRGLSRTQTGLTRGYAVGMVLGTALLLFAILVTT